MDQNGGLTEVSGTCRRDGVATRLQCSECGTPICTACYVRTAVGLRCQDCGAASGPPVRWSQEAQRSWLVPAVVAVVVALVLAGGAWAAGRGGEEAAVDLGETGDPAAAQVRIGSGELLSRGTWALDARRGRNICRTLTLSPGPPGRERCDPPPRDRHIGRTTTSTLSHPSGTVYLTVGLVSERTERVVVAPEGAASWEVPALGGEAELGGRFFVAQVTEHVDVTFTALAADGSELARSVVPPPRRR